MTAENKTDNGRKDSIKDGIENGIEDSIKKTVKSEEKTSMYNRKIYKKLTAQAKMENRMWDLDVTLQFVLATFRYIHPSPL